jgi:hypothetical protein
LLLVYQRAHVGVEGCGEGVWAGAENTFFWVLPPFGTRLALALACESKCCCSHSPPQNFEVYRVQQKNEKNNLPRFFPFFLQAYCFGKTAKRNAFQKALKN